MVANIVGGASASVDWYPLDYGSYDIVAVYTGDSNYHPVTSEIAGASCTTGSDLDTALRVTGLGSGKLTYGDTLTLGATVSNSGIVRNLSAAEISFAVLTGGVSDPAGLLVEQTDSQWCLTALQSGTYKIEATVGNLKVTRSVVVSKASIAIAVVNQVRSVNTPNDPVEIELLEGEMKLGDTLESKFTTEYACPANQEIGRASCRVTV